MKLLILLFSFLSFFGNDFNKKELNMKSSYQEINEIVYQYGKYSVIERENVVEILYNDQRIDLISNIYCYKVIVTDELLTVFYKKTEDDYVFVCKFNKGKIALDKKINNKFIKEFDVVYFDNKYIFVSSIREYENKIIISKYNQKDYLLNDNAIVLQLDNNIDIVNCEIYGGELNEYFNKIYLDHYNEIVYITGMKDQDSGYDFGNGGSGSKGYIFCKIDDDLDVVKYIIVDFPINNVDVSNDIKIFTVYDVFLVNSDLCPISSLRFDGESVFGIGVDKSWVVLFGVREAKFYNFDRKELVQIYEYQDINELYEAKIIDDFLILKDKNKIYKGIFYNDLFSDKCFVYDNLELSKLNTSVIGVPRSYKLQEIGYDNNYDPLIFGEYNICFVYEFFQIDSKLIVLDRCNVTNDYIYPVGYNILFSGLGYLNDIEVYNNHEITEPGDYTLKLIGKDEEKVINFKVYDMDITYTEENLKNWDYEVRVNQALELSFNYNESLEIEEIVINNEIVNFENNIEENKVTISFVNNQVGSYEYLFNHIVFRKEDKLYKKEINYFFKVKVLQEKISIENDFYNDDEYFIFKTNLIENNNQVRFIKIVDDLNYYYIPIKKGDIVIENEISNVQDLKFYLVYDVEGKLYEEQILFDITLDLTKKQSIGIMELGFESNELKEIVIKIPIDESVKEIKVEDSIYYEGKNTVNYYSLIYFIMLVSIILIVFKIIKKLSKNKKSK